jgi:transposase, IS5 family
VLTLFPGQVESMCDEVLPASVRELPEDLARLDRVLSDPGLLAPIAASWEESARGRGRPSIAMTNFVRLMVVKQRTGWGYETLVREVSDSLHLRRFCLIGIDQPVPSESTVRKPARRLGAEVMAEITRVVIAKAQRETRFRVRAAPVDSTVVEADIAIPRMRCWPCRACARSRVRVGSSGRCSAMRPSGWLIGRVRSVAWCGR